MLGFEKPTPRPGLPTTRPPLQGAINDCKTHIVWMYMYMIAANEIVFDIQCSSFSSFVALYPSQIRLSIPTYYRLSSQFWWFLFLAMPCAIPRHTCLPNEYLWWDFKREIELFFMVNFSHFLIAIELLTSFTAHHVLHQFSLIRGFLISYQGFSHPSHPLLCPYTPFPFCTTEPPKSHTNTYTIRIEDERLFSLSFEI